MRAYERLNTILEKSYNLDSYILKVISYAYKNTILICNPVLSRNPFASSLLFKVGRGKSIDKTDYKKLIFIKLARYYFKSFVFFFFFLTHFLAYKSSRLRLNSSLLDKNKDLIIINTFVMIDRIYPKGKFDDSIFGSLYEIMEKRDRQYVVLCFLFGDKPWNFKRRIQTYNILAEDGRNFVTEFKLMGVTEWIELLKFIFIYPFVTLGLVNKTFGEFDMLFRQEIVNTLDSVQFQHYVSYLAGRNLNLLTNQRLNVICWYENQVTDKLLFRGIKETVKDVKIFGCEFTDKPLLYKSLYPLPEEIKYNVLPDIRLVSGKYYLNESPKFNIKLGISPRYNDLFDIDLKKSDILDRQGILILLTYDIDESKRIIELVEAMEEINLKYRIRIKLHPNHLLLKPFSYPKTWKYTKEKLVKLCFDTSVVVTAGTSAALESAIMGCSVIIITDSNGFTMNPMPDYGRGRIWDIVSDANELKQVLDVLCQYRHKNPDEIISMAEELRDMFFTKATEQKYIELFDL